VGVVVDEEALHAGPKDDEETRGEGGLGSVQVVLRDLPADDDPRTDIEPSVDALRHSAADVVEVDVDPIGARGLELLAEALVFVVDRLVVAVQLAVGALVRPAGDPHRSAARELRDLTDHLPDGARRA
jgi:hypothetical protein